MPELPDLDVVVVAYGDPDALRRNLERLGGAYRLLVVDNSSSSATAAVAADLGARYIDPGENLGFAAGVNRGLQELDLHRGDVLLLNPDATVDPDTVEVLHRRLYDSSDLACVAPAQRRPGWGGPSAARWPFATPGRAWAEAIGLGRLRAVRSAEGGFLVGAVLLMRGAALDEIGGFDEGFFLYAEEADWQRRAIQQGWRVGYCPEVCAEHAGAGTDTDTERYQLRFHAAVERYVRKWHGAAGWRSYQTATILTALRRALVGRGGRRRRSLRLAALYAAGPYRRAVRAGAVPPRRHLVPSLGAPGSAGQADRSPGGVG